MEQVQVRQNPQPLFEANFKHLPLPPVFGNFTLAKGEPFSNYPKYDFLNSNRHFGYLPIIGFVSGSREISLSLYTIFKKVIQNDNTIYFSTVRFQDAEMQQFGQKVYLSLGQKIRVLARCIALFFRGFITFCQLGFVFAPFDFAVNQCYN